MLFGFLSTLAYGSTLTVAKDAEIPATNFIVFGTQASFQPFPPMLQAVEDHEAQTDLTVEARLLHPFSTEFQMPWVWRVDYEQGAKRNTIFLLGSAHGVFPAQALPFSVLKNIGYADALLSEIGEYVLDSEDSLVVDYPIARALKKDGTYFGEIDAGDANGWLKLVPDYLREPFRNSIKTNLRLWGFDEEVVSQFHHYDPRLFAQLLEIYNEAQLGYRSSLIMHGINESMDDMISNTFSDSKKLILSLEDQSVRKDAKCKALKAGQTHSIDTVESDIETLRINWMSQPKDDELREKVKRKLQEEYAYCKYTIKDYRNGYGEPDDTDKTNYYMDFRNQYWLENTLSQALHSRGPTLIMVGNGHLDWGWIEHIGKTGLLNFFQKLQDTDTAWHGAKVTSIQRLISMYPHSRFTSELGQYHWVPWTVSTDGPYLEELMHKLRNESPSGATEAAGGAGAGAGATAF